MVEEAIRIKIKQEVEQKYNVTINELDTRLINPAQYNLQPTPTI